MTDPSEPQAELEARLRQGDEQALAEVFSLHRERLRRMVGFRLHSRLRGRVGPDDVLQEGYLAAAQRLKHFADNTAMSPFVQFSHFATAVAQERGVFRQSRPTRGSESELPLIQTP